MESHSQIEDEVAERLAQRDSGSWSENDETRFQEWVAASTARRVAYLRLKSTWDAAARLRVLRACAAHEGGAPASGGVLPPGGVPPPGEWRRSPFFELSVTHGLATAPRKHAFVDAEPEAVGPGTAPASRPHSDPGSVLRAATRRQLRFAGAAGFVLAMATAFGLYHLWSAGGERYATPVGGFASVPMADGSNVTLNTDSVIRVNITGTERRVQLDQGEAFFDVARDAARPFVVRAGNKRVVAVGTRFSVQRLEDDVRVVVTEGKVRVESAQSPPVLVAAGNVARAADMAVVVQQAPPPRVEEYLSWREGYLRFHEMALADAVAEMNRYNTRKIVIDDPRLAAVRISGTFRPTQYEAFVRVLQDGFSIQARNTGERILLTQAE